MKKFFGFGKSKDKDAANNSNARKSGASSAASELEKMKAEMQTYKGQKYNPSEDDGITTESLFKVVDGDAGN